LTLRILVTGASGILGRQLQRLRPAELDLVALSHSDLDVTSRADTLRIVEGVRPDVVIHGAALTDVDGCEARPEEAFRVNWVGTANVAEACERTGAVPVYLSTDYVFDGETDKDYLEHDPVRPLSVYGRSKWCGEQAILQRCRRFYIVRTQWVFGPFGRNFVDTMLAIEAEGKPLRVVADQRGCPTYAADLAEGIFRLIEREPGYGIYHLSSRGEASWFEFARAIFAETGRRADLSSCTSADCPRPAKRPRRSVLRNFHLELTIGDFMPTWVEGLRRYLREYPCSPKPPTEGTGVLR